MSAPCARRGMLAVVAVLSTIVLSAPARADTVTQWNETATNVLVADNQGAIALAHLAMVHGAVYDAVNAIDGRYEPYLTAPPAKPWYSQDAAAATAAYRVLVGSRPAVVSATSQPLLDGLKATYEASLAAIPAGPAKDGGIATGNAAAAAMIAARLNDGRFGSFRFTVGTRPGEWKPVLPTFVNDPGAWVKDVKPFLIENASEFGGGRPYELTSREYAKEFNEVKTLGAMDSTARTSDQTAAGSFWGATNSVGTWGRLYRDIAERHGGSLADDARLFAMLYLAGADAAITVWTDKAKFSFWRPVSAIREADTDGNPQTVADPKWLPLVGTPPYPDQPSGLAALSGASAQTLQAFFGTDDFAFGTTNAVKIERKYTSFSQAVNEVIDARVWAGIHFRNADEQGAAIGERVARAQENQFPQADDHDAEDDDSNRKDERGHTGAARATRSR